MFVNRKLLASVAMLVAVAVTAPALADVLIYWDQSPNLEIDVEAAQYVAAQHGEEVTLVTDARVFAWELEYMGWSYVVVAKEDASDSASYAEALADYADYYGDVYWHVSLDLDGESVSIAYATWWRGHTTVAYAGLGSRSAWTVAGYKVPDFAHVDVGDYVGSAMARPRMRRSSGIDTCKDTCVNEFTDAVFTCIHQYEADVANCKAAYPDQGPEYDSCIDDAHEDRENCLTAASHRLAICYALCDKENAGPVNPVEPEPLP